MFSLKRESANDFGGEKKSAVSNRLRMKIAIHILINVLTAIYDDNVQAGKK